MNGDLSAYTVTGNRGSQLTRKFCPICGTPILTELHAIPQWMVLKAGTLDDPSWLKPEMHIWTASGQPRTEAMPELPKFEKNPD